MCEYMAWRYLWCRYYLLGNLYKCKYVETLWLMINGLLLVLVCRLFGLVVAPCARSVSGLPWRRDCAARLEQARARGPFVEDAALGGRAARVTGEILLCSMASRACLRGAVERSKYNVQWVYSVIYYIIYTMFNKKSKFNIYLLKVFYAAKIHVCVYLWFDCKWNKV